LERYVTFLRRAVLLLTISAALLTVTGASASSVASSSTAAAAAPAKANAVPHPATPKQWAKIVAAAKKEGSVTLYTSQNPTFLADTAKAFESKYGIKVTVNRQIDSVLTNQVSSEEAAHKLNVDVLVIASLPVVYGMQKPENKWVADAVGPALYAKAYDRKVFGGPQKANVVGCALLGIAWNTGLYPPGLKDYNDLLSSNLKGKIGVVAPSAPSIVDFYLWLEKNFGGKSFMSKLADQKPKIYASSLPMTQAVVSGEITAGQFIATSAIDLKGQGAPITFKLVAKNGSTWNAPWWGMVMKGSPHPNAAQLFMNYLVTKEGQQTSQHHLGAVLKKVPETWYVTPRKQVLKDLTPAKVQAYQSYWNGLFRG
jgi:iron(III) transport system substrate-binding protein